MAGGRSGSVARQVRALFGAGTVAGLAEGQLLDRFLARRDEAAFEALVVRFGPMVMGVCRGLLDDPHDADDAFQATFLVLVKKAGAIRDRTLVGNWLYGVAYRVASRARVESARRRRREDAKEGPDVAAPADGEPRADDEWRPLLHAEVARLPAKYREPVVLCYLQGQTHEEAARSLSWPVGTVKGRLSRARKLLRDRLVRRGVAPSAGAVVAALGRESRAAVPDLLIRDTVAAAMAVAAGKAVAAGAVSATASALAEGVVRTMWIAKLKLAAAALLAVGVVMTGVGVSARLAASPRASQDAGGGAARARDDGEVPKAAEEPSLRHDPQGATPKAPRAGDGDVLEGTPSVDRGPVSGADLDPIATRRLQAASAFLGAAKAFYEQGTITIDRYVSASERLLETQLELFDQPGIRREALAAHVGRLRRLVERERAKFEVGAGSIPNVAEAELALAEAEYRADRARHGGRTISAPSTDQRPGPTEGDGSDQSTTVPTPGDDLRSDEIRTTLGRPISMPFVNETPLEDVIRYIKRATEAPDRPGGLPIFVDPEGLQEAEKTMQSPIVLELEGISLQRSLRLALRQLGLAYAIKDGLLFISTPDLLDDLLLESPEHQPSEFAKLRRKAGRGELTPEEASRWEDLKQQIEAAPGGLEGTARGSQ